MTHIDIQPGDVICLCGSTKFLKQFEEVKNFAEKQGAVVFTPEVYHHYYNVNLTVYQTEVLNELHQLKIGLADYVIVINVDGYIGETTQDEIEFAHDLGIPVHYLELGDNK